MTAIIWLIIMAVLIVIELATLGLTTIWFAPGHWRHVLPQFWTWRFGSRFWLFIVVSVSAADQAHGRWRCVTLMPEPVRPM